MNVLAIWIWSVLGGVALMATTVSGQCTNPPGTCTWVNVRTLETSLGLHMTEQGTNGLVLASSNMTFEGTAGSRSIKVQGTLVYLNGPLVKGTNGWEIDQGDVDHTIVPLVNPDCWSNAAMTGTVLLDPGHGGEQDGAKVDGVCEKDLTLDVAKRTRTILKKAGMKVNLTRTRDNTLSLDARPAMLAKTKSDFMVSIHFNHAERAATSGIETYVLTAPGFPSTADAMDPTAAPTWVKFAGNAQDSQSLILAYRIQRSLIASTGATDRGVKRARFAILRTATAPAILVECGFMSNPDEFLKIKDESYRELLAKTLATEIIGLGKPSIPAKP